MSFPVVDCWVVLILIAGVSIPGASLLEKRISLKGMNNLDGGVKVNNFDLPGNDPIGGIRLTLNTMVTNVSNTLFMRPRYIPTGYFAAFTSWDIHTNNRVPGALPGCGYRHSFSVICCQSSTSVHDRTSALWAPHSAD